MQVSHWEWNVNNFDLQKGSTKNANISNQELRNLYLPQKTESFVK